MNHIQDILKEQGRSQTWLSEKLGKSYNMVNSYVKNRRQPSLEVLYRIADILDVDPGQLIYTKKQNNTVRNLLIDFMEFAINADRIPEHSTKELIVDSYLSQKNN